MDKNLYFIIVCGSFIVDWQNNLIFNYLVTAARKQLHPVNNIFEMKKAWGNQE